MSVKVLHRRPGPTVVTSLPGLTSAVPPSTSGIGSLIGDTAGSAASSFSAAAIQSFLASKISSVDAASVASLAGTLKVPLLIALGIAAAAALAYLVYLVYTHREPIGNAINKVIADLKSIAPDLTAIPGWLDNIKREVADAFSSSNPATALEKLAKIKKAVLGHQVGINPSNVGSGIDLFGHHSHMGGGLKVPM
jgi:hypothetical protein